MPVGEVTVRMTLDNKGYTAGMTDARRQAQQTAKVIEMAGHSTVSAMQASSAALRTLEGGMTNSIRAAERFISMIPGVGKALQAAFPVIGGLAFAGVIARIGDAAYRTVHELGQIRNVANESFAKLSEGAQKNADSLRVTNDRLEQQIAALERRPVNNLALALDEARVRADELASSLDNDYQSFKKIIEETQKGMLSTLFNKGVDSQLGNQMNDQLANIRTLARQQRDALKAGNQESADDLAQKLRAAQDAALSFADSQIRTRSGIANKGTAREASYAKVYGDQGQNFDAINAFKDLVSGQEDTSNQQQRNTADQATKTRLEAAKAAAETQKSAQELIVQQWHKNLEEQKADNDMTVAQEAQFWVQRMEAAKKGSLSYLAALSEVNRDIAKMRAENIRGQGQFDTTSAGAYSVAGMDLSKGDTSSMQQGGRAASEYLKTLNEGISIHRQSAVAIAEESLQMQVLTGRMSKLDEAQALAALHTQEYNDAQAALQTALANANALPDSVTKQTTIAGLNNQGTQMAGQRAIQVAQDQQAISGNTVSGAQREALDKMVQSWDDMAGNLKSLIPQMLNGLNDDLAKLISGHGSKADFGKTLTETGQSMIKTALQKLEAAPLKALGLGKADGSQQNPWYVVPLGGSLGGSTPPFVQPFVAGQQGQGGQQDQGGQQGQGGQGSGQGKGSIWGQLGHLAQSFVSGLFKSQSDSGGGGGGGGDGIGDSSGGDTSFQGGFAGGGDVLANRPAIIGERGPEMFIPRTAGRIVPNHMLGGDGGSNHTINIDARGSNDPAAITAAVHRAAPAIVAASMQVQHSSAKRSPHGK